MSVLGNWIKEFMRIGNYGLNIWGKESKIKINLPNNWRLITVMLLWRRTVLYRIIDKGVMEN
jgi:hypothetical protein